MNLFENIRLALEGLRANKMRALLTMLGIIIGIASVMAITTLGSAMTNSITSSMDKLGGKNITVSLDPKDYDNASELKPEDYFSETEINTFKKQYPDKIKAISLSQNAGSGKLNSGFIHKDISLTGTNPDYSIVNNINIVHGRFISDRDMQSNRKVIIIDTILKNILVGENGNPLGLSVSVKTALGNETYTIIGVYQKETNDNPMFSMGEDARVQCFIPITTAKSLDPKNTVPLNSYNTFTIMATPETNSSQFAITAKDFFDKGLGKFSDYKVYAMSMESMTQETTSMMGTLSLGLSVIAGISLLVGGIGVMNIMLVSVTERTKEIGIRKALGAPNSAIRSQFIIESIIICLIGGIIGIILGAILGITGSSLLKFPVNIPIKPMLIALVFSMSIGVFFGYYPANKAAKLNPIDALRYE